MPYKNELRAYDMYFHPLWNWTQDLLEDQQLAPHFVWDAQHLYKYNGQSFIRFYHEPWTGDRFWDVQVFVIIQILSFSVIII